MPGPLPTGPFTVRPTFACVAAAGGGNLPSAPTLLQVFPQVGGVTAYCSTQLPPGSDYANVITKFTLRAYTYPGTVLAATGGSYVDYLGLGTGVSNRMDLFGLTIGQQYTVTAYATNANGDGPESAQSSPFTAADYPLPSVAGGAAMAAYGFAGGEDSHWSMYNGSTGGAGVGLDKVEWANTSDIGTTQGGNPLTAYAGTTVVKCSWSSNHFFMPYAVYDDAGLTTIGASMFQLTPYNYMSWAVWPTVTGMQFQNRFEQVVRYYGVVTDTSPDQLTFIDNTQQWISNKFNTGFSCTDVTKNGSIGRPVSSNTATRLSLSSSLTLTPAAGDQYSNGWTDKYVGQQLTFGNGTNSAWINHGSTGGLLVPGQWNVINIPLSAFETIANELVLGQMLEFQPNLTSTYGGGAVTFYFGAMGLTVNGL